jgi:hypothetical protein
MNPFNRCVDLSPKLRQRIRSTIFSEWRLVSWDRWDGSSRVSSRAPRCDGWSSGNGWPRCLGPARLSPMFFSAGGVRCASLGTGVHRPGPEPGSMSRSSGGCRHRLPVARLPALRKATEAGDRPSRWVGCANWLSPAEPAFYRWRRVGSVRPVDIEVRNEMQRIALGFSC